MSFQFPAVSFSRVPIDINYRCSAQRSDPHLHNRWRGLAILAREIGYAQWRYHHSSRLTSLCFRSCSRIPPAERGGRAFSRRDGRKTVPLLPSPSTCPASLSSSFTPVSVPLVPSHVWPVYHLSFCQLGDFNLLSFCAITGPRGPRKIVFNCD